MLLTAPLRRARSSTARCRSASLACTETQTIAISASTSRLASPRTEMTGSGIVRAPIGGEAPALSGSDPDRVPDGLDLQEGEHPGRRWRRGPVLLGGEHPLDVTRPQPFQFGPAAG